MREKNRRNSNTLKGWRKTMTKELVYRGVKYTKQVEVASGVAKASK